MVMLFNATFNNISVILWQSVLLVAETGVLEEIHQGHHGHDCMVVGFTTNYAISAYHH
jgi:hypothetical protein